MKLREWQDNATDWRDQTVQGEWVPLNADQRSIIADLAHREGVPPDIWLAAQVERLIVAEWGFGTMPKVERWDA